MPASKKDETRERIGHLLDSGYFAHRGAHNILIRVNSEPEVQARDLERVAHPDVAGVLLPKTNTAKEFRSRPPRLLLHALCWRQLTRTALPGQCA